MMSLLFILLIVAVYFLPTIIAFIKGHEKTLAISRINLALGWTVFVWIILLLWVVNDKAEKQIATLLSRIKIG